MNVGLMRLCRCDVSTLLPCFQRSELYERQEQIKTVGVAIPNNVGEAFRVVSVAGGVTVLIDVGALVVESVTELALHEAVGVALSCAVEKAQLARNSCHAYCVQTLAKLSLRDVLGVSASILCPPVAWWCS